MNVKSRPDIPNRSTTATRKRDASHLGNDENRAHKRSRLPRSSSRSVERDRDVFGNSHPSSQESLREIQETASQELRRKEREKRKKQNDAVRRSREKKNQEREQCLQDIKMMKEAKERLDILNQQLDEDIAMIRAILDKSGIKIPPLRALQTPKEKERTVKRTEKFLSKREIKLVGLMHPDQKPE